MGAGNRAPHPQFFTSVRVSCPRCPRTRQRVVFSSHHDYRASGERGRFQKAPLARERRREVAVRRVDLAQHAPAARAPVERDRARPRRERRRQERVRERRADLLLDQRELERRERGGRVGAERGGRGLGRRGRARATSAARRAARGERGRARPRPRARAGARGSSGSARAAAAARAPRGSPRARPPSRRRRRPRVREIHERRVALARAALLMRATTSAVVTVAPGVGHTTGACAART